MRNIISEKLSKEDVQKVLSNCFSNDQEVIKKGDSSESQKIFSQNTEILKQIIHFYGWPNSKDYGEQASSNAWLIAQHSDSDKLFQLQCLSLIISSEELNPEMKANIAYLLDRILINLGGKQVFGTQLNNKTTLPETVLPEKLNFLRKQMNLDTIESYASSQVNHKKP